MSKEQTERVVEILVERANKRSYLALAELAHALELERIPSSFLPALEEALRSRGVKILSGDAEGAGDPDRRGQAKEGNQGAVDALRILERDVGQTAKLTRVQEIELGIRILDGVRAALVREERDDLSAEQVASLTVTQDNGKNAANTLAESHFPKILGMARRVAGRNRDLLLELFGLGATKCLLAAHRYDYRHGARFSTFLDRSHVDKDMRASDTAGLGFPPAIQQDIKRVYGKRAELVRLLGEEPTVEQVAEACGMTPSRVELLLEAGRRTLSLSDQVGDEGSTTLEEHLEGPPPEEPIEHEIDRTRNRAALREQLDRLRETVETELPLGEARALLGRIGLVAPAIDMYPAARRLLEARAATKLRRTHGSSD